MTSFSSDRSTLLRGSLALDSILIHRGAFHARILPESLSRLNVSFGVDETREEFGGTAGNIAHNMALLGSRPLVSASVGSLDASLWIERLHGWGLDASALHVVEGARSARATLLTDELNNQISAFDPGAMRRIAPAPALNGFARAHLAPDTADSMMAACSWAQAADLPYYLDPGQALPSLLEGQGSEHLPWRSAVRGCSGLFVNEYEAELLARAAGVSFEQIASTIPFAIRTLGASGSELFADGQRSMIPVCKPDRISDPTGCGDAFRGGFLRAQELGWSLIDSARLGSTMGSFAIETSGGQNHRPSLEAIQSRFETHFGRWPESAPKPRSPGP